MIARPTLLLFAVLASACGGSRARDGQSPASDPLAAEKAAFDRARPVFQAHCAKCHSKGGETATAEAVEHVDMTSYPFGGHHAGEIAPEIREALGIGGGAATMPKDHPGAVKGSELDLVAAWADAWDAADRAGAHGGHHEHGDHHH